MTPAGMLLLWVLAALPSQASEGEDQVLRRRVTTADGVALALYRYRPAEGVAARPAVLLIPDLGMNRSAFDLQGHGLARFLQQQGRDVFVLEPRGHGSAAAPAGWHLAELLAQDFPAAAKAIGSIRPGPFDLVVQGFSGALAMAATEVELKGRVRRVVALNPAVMPELPNSVVEAVLSGGGRLSTLGNQPEGAKAFELLFSRGGRFDPGRLTELRAAAFSDLGETAAAELLSWMRTGDLECADRTTVLARLSRYDRPTLLVLALADNFAHPEFATPLRTLGRAPVSVRVLTRRDLLKEDYTHLSLLHGAAAAEDVFAPLAAFLSAPSEAGPPAPEPRAR